MSFREVRVHEIREVLRLWLRGQRDSAPQPGMRRWTVRRCAATWRRRLPAGSTATAGRASSRYTVAFHRTDVLLKRLRASRLDNSHKGEMRKLLRVDLLILDDFALQGMDALDTSDLYDLIVERHRAASTVVTSNREPIEWLGQMADALLAQSAIDRLQSAAYELVLDGESYRRHQKPGLDVGSTTPRPRRRRRPTP